MRTCFSHFFASMTEWTRLLLILTVCLLYPAVNIAAEKPSVRSLQPEISYSTAGQGTPLILVHAFPADSRLWAPQIDGLKSSFRIITPDLQGFGHGKPAQGEAVTMSEHAQHIKKIMDELHIKKAILGGESMGGYVVLAFLSQYPDRVAGIILSNTRSTADSADVKAQREAAAQDVLTHGTEAFINSFMNKALSANASEQTRSTARAIFSGQTANGIASGLRGMALRGDTTHILSETSVPVLIITSDQDSAIPPRESEDMHARAKNSRLVTLSNSGHLSNLEQPGQWNKAVMDFYSIQNN
ncbi:AB hydrolase superfamily protein YdjP [Aquicella siphonis]|uniref:AB hydrolase superfamily protein YdjP n=1 Tax=Aquicella siphonis TaxID=254247 RepID=A0A5E4PIS3_9COXI|nr:alpha/beta hydrolase [Aquicella siphonis]VVC76196.1 AB hydrolase superfamily protein YdjP [Aquicella siphonis]